MARKKQPIGGSDGPNHNGNNASALLNFQYARPPSQQPPRPTNHHYQQQSSRSSSNSNIHNRRNNSNPRNANRNSQTTARSSRKSSDMFFLHSSPNHAFVLTRVPSRLEQYTFQNADTPVSWHAVRLVKYFSTALQQESCPICLDSFCCPRITKCGHVFCLPCLLHHSHASPNSDKCPCCAMTTCLSDLRPVLVQSTTPPMMHQTIRLVKLARTKHCSSPYLLQAGAPKRSSPRAAPCVTDVDAAFCKFNLVDPDVYHEHLMANVRELQQSDPNSINIFTTLALDLVQEELRKALLEAPMEREKMEQFASPASGMYQWTQQQVQSPREEAMASAFRNESVIDSPDSQARSRGDSIVSYDSQSTHQSSVPGGHHGRGGSRYLDNPEDHVFYQAQDGTLCFLCGFNMKCLQAEYAVCPTDDGRPPLPDVVQGRIVELERVVLTQEKRQRFRFLSHLPIDSEIVFVEVNLGQLLRKETKKQFQKEFNKRKQTRMSRQHADKAAEDRQRRIEEARIEELKSRFQRIDPSDEFFHSPEPEPAPVLTGDEFGPSVSTARSSNLDAMGAANTGMSFSQLIRTKPGLRDFDFPTLGSDGPTLGSSPPRASAPQWAKPAMHGSVDVEPRALAAETQGAVDSSLGKKRSKGKKVLLFSTGGHHSGIS